MDADAGSVPHPPLWRRPGIVAAVALGVMTVALTVSANVAWLRSGEVAGPPGPTPGPQTVLMAEYLIGVQSMLGPMLNNELLNISDLVEQTAATTPAPVGNLHAAMLSVWFEGPEMARAYLNEAGTELAVDPGAALGTGPEVASDGAAADGANGASTPSARDEFGADHATLVVLIEDGADAIDQAARDRLVNRYGLLGEMALASRTDASDPARVAIEGRGWSTAFVMFGFGGVVFGALGIGFVLMIVAIVLAVQGRIRPTYDWWIVRHAADARGGMPGGAIHPAYLESACVFLALFVLFKIGLGLVPALGVVSPLIQWGLLGAAAWPLVRGVPWGELRMVVGWHRGRGVAAEVLAGIGGYLALLPGVAVAFAVVLALVFVGGRLGLPAPGHPATDQAAGTSWVDALVLYSLVAVWAPVVEETVFRGLLYHPVRRWAGVLGGAAVSAVIFAAIHPQGVLIVPALAALGFNFALLREWRGSAIAPMVAHGLHNTVVLTFALLLFG
ncbi:MAG: type II CAAX endopeptidase family protein [Planctomycetota bacterium]